MHEEKAKTQTGSQDYNQAAQPFFSILINFAIKKKLLQYFSTSTPDKSDMSNAIVKTHTQSWIFKQNKVLKNLTNLIPIFGSSSFDSDREVIP